MPPPTIRRARDRDIPALAALHADVARDLTVRSGRGHWSHEPSERLMARHLADSTVLVAVVRQVVVGTLRLQTRKPWAIDTAFFTPVERPLYVLDMAVTPTSHGRGVGRTLISAAMTAAAAWPADALRLDAYAGPAGAGAFYARCGFEPRGSTLYRGVALAYFERLIARAGPGADAALPDQP